MTRPNRNFFLQDLLLILKDDPTFCVPVMQTEGVGSPATELKQPVSGPSGWLSQMTDISEVLVACTARRGGKNFGWEKWVFTISLQQVLFQTKLLAIHKKPVFFLWLSKYQAQKLEPLHGTGLAPRCLHNSNVLKNWHFIT